MFLCFFPRNIVDDKTLAQWNMELPSDISYIGSTLGNISLPLHQPKDSQVDTHLITHHAIHNPQESQQDTISFSQPILQVTNDNESVLLHEDSLQTLHHNISSNSMQLGLSSLPVHDQGIQHIDCLDSIRTMLSQCIEKTHLLTHVTQDDVVQINMRTLELCSLVDQKLAQSGIPLNVINNA